jgi:cytochrome c oxidase subunit 2
MIMEKTNNNIAGFWDNATDLVAGLDEQFYWMHVILVGLMLTVLVPMVYFIFKYSEKNHPKEMMPTAENTLTHHTGMEIAWTAIPTAFLMVVFYFGYDSLKNLRTMPADATHIKVVGKMWSWTYIYENGKKTNILYVPKGENIVLDMTAPKNDVLHSFWIPAFRQKEDVVPGRTTQLWFNANQTGEFDVECTEYCGDQHSFMLSKVKVLEQNDYTAWYDKQDKVSGKDLFAGTAGCTSCHTTGTDTIVGPGLAGMASKSKAYLKDALMNPDKDVASGFYPGIMPSSKGALSDEEVDSIVDYLKTLK